MKHNIIINADDFGMHAQANQGILYCLDNNLINSVSVCVNYPSSSPDLHNSKIESLSGLGLHINLSEGVSLSRSQALGSNQGSLHQATNLFSKSEQITEDDFYREITAQLRQFISIYNCPPTHLDSHQYITYLLPRAFRAMLMVAEQYRIPIRSPEIFTSPAGLKRFKQSVLLNHQVVLPFNASTQAKILRSIFEKFDVHVRSGKLITDFTSVPQAIGTGEDKQVEIVCHPQQNSCGGLNNDIVLLKKLHLEISRTVEHTP